MSLFDPAQDGGHLRFAFEDTVEDECHRRLVASGMDRDVCKYFLANQCKQGNRCPMRHQRDKSVVCKHWLRGLCKKADACEFLHEYDLSKMPPCQFIATYGECSKGNDCPFLHITPEDLIRDCPWYARGHCKHGPNCRNRHTRREACGDYLAGFCPLGPKCTKGHPKGEIPVDLTPVAKLCSRCGQMGHTVESCRSDPVRYDEKEPPPPPGRAALHNNRPIIERRQPLPDHLRTNTPINLRYHNSNNHHNAGGGGGGYGYDGGGGGARGDSRPLDQVTCFKCGQTGHYANKCTNERVPAPPGGYQPPATSHAGVTYQRQSTSWR